MGKGEKEGGRDHKRILNININQLFFVFVYSLYSTLISRSLFSSVVKILRSGFEL